MNPVIYIHQSDPPLLLFLIMNGFCRFSKLLIQPCKSHFIHTDPVIGDTDDQTIPGALKTNVQITAFDFQFYPVDDTVFQDRLQGKLWNPAVHDPLIFFHVILDMQLQSVPKTIFLNPEIIFAVIQFFFYRYQIFDLRDRVTKKSCKSLRHIRNSVKTCNNGFPANTLQCIIQKVGIDLILKSQVLSLSFIQIHILRRTQDLIYHLHLLSGGRCQVQKLHIIFFRKEIPLQKSVHHLFAPKIRPYQPEPAGYRKQYCHSCKKAGTPPRHLLFICQ